MCLRSRARLLLHFTYWLVYLAGISNQELGCEAPVARCAVQVLLRLNTNCERLLLRRNLSMLGCIPNTNKGHYMICFYCDRITV